MVRGFLNANLILLALLAAGCGGAQSASHTPTVSIDSQFQPVVNSFINEAQNQSVNIKINDLVVQGVSNLDGQTMGECETDPSGATSPTIYISQSFWDALDSNGQEELLFHELGHCVLGRVHEDTLSGGVPVSMMNGVFLGSALYQANKSQYMHELFLQSNLPSAFPLVTPMDTFLPDFAAPSNS